MDVARRRESLKRGGKLDRVDVPELANPETDQLDLFALDEALKTLEREHPEKGQIVKLRFFTGCTLEESADYLGISRATAQRHWAFARAWLFGQLNPAQEDPKKLSDL